MYYNLNSVEKIKNFVILRSDNQWYICSWLNDKCMNVVSTVMPLLNVILLLFTIEYVFIKKLCTNIFTCTWIDLPVCSIKIS